MGLVERLLKCGHFDFEISWQIDENIHDPSFVQQEVETHADHSNGNIHNKKTD